MSIREQKFKFETVTVNEQGVITARRSQVTAQLSEDLGSGVSLELVTIPGGAFGLGSPPGQGYADEQPQHRVTITPFWLARCPVTQAQWQAVMGYLPPCRFAAGNRPVENVSWDDAGAFCERLSARTGRSYGLPGEAQWEYACRAGTTTPFAFGPTLTTDLANYNGQFTYRAEPKGLYRHETTPAGSFPPNAFGLFDMHGNVWEWCADPWHDNYQAAPSDGTIWSLGGDPVYRVARGGSWHDTPDVCRSATRLKAMASEGDDIFGFRVALAGWG